MKKCLFLSVFLLVLLALSVSFADDRVYLGCGPAKIVLPSGYTLTEKPIPYQPRMYASFESNTVLTCFDFMTEFPELNMPLYSNDAELIQIMLQFKETLEEGGYSVSFSSVDECAAIIAENSESKILLMIHQYGLPVICAAGEQYENALNEISIEIEDYRASE